MSIQIAHLGYTCSIPAIYTDCYTNSTYTKLIQKNNFLYIDQLSRYTIIILYKALQYQTYTIAILVVYSCMT